MIKKKLLILGLSAMMTCAAVGCGKKEEETTAAVQDSKEYSINVTESSMLNSGNLDDVDLSKDGKVRSDLTGEWIDKDLARRKPIACMINNFEAAMPQAGIGSADVIYEMLEEGGITRTLCLFTDYDNMEKIGPMRSTRSYYVRKSVEHQAVLVHWGGSDNPNVEVDFANYPGIEHVDFNSGVEGGYRVDRPGKAEEHTAYISGKAVNDWRADQPFQLEKNENYKKMFNFNTNDTEPAGGKDAKKITTEISNYTQPWFEYDDQTKLYKRFQYGEPQIDELTNEQLTFKNVIILFARHALRDPEWQNLEGNEIDIDLLGKGDGFYASDGKIIPITWEKDDITDVTQYYTSDGENLQINPGKTWITYMQDDNKAGLKVE